ncbi:MAG: serine/threonine protein kinase [Phycisphaeraceae bacterium]|nr:serine/threonine protein kinase [Phycisphaeraceae bacterium]
MEIFKKGDMVEGFRIERELGRGAASIIYLAWDPRTKHIWALKHVERGDAKDDRFLVQAEAEYKAASAQDHPGVRKITRCIKKGSIFKTNELFLVMELVDGRSLELAPPRTMAQAVHIFEQVARALGHMHQRGWVHADMKPNNIVVDGDTHAKIIDLGQSCKIGTVKARIQGTPDYIAPEQVHRREITPRTDVYNLGATMYWVLCRQHIPTALPKDDRLVGSLDAALIEKPKPPHEINPRVPLKLSELILQCVEAMPENRPQSMDIVADRLNLIHGMILAARASEGSTMGGLPSPDPDDDGDDDGLAIGGSK